MYEDTINSNKLLVNKAKLVTGKTNPMELFSMYLINGDKSDSSIPNQIENTMKTNNIDQTYMPIQSSPFMKRSFSKRIPTSTIATSNFESDSDDSDISVVEVLSEDEKETSINTSSNDQWSCPQCTFLNDSSLDHCDICGFYHSSDSDLTKKHDIIQWRKDIIIGRRVDAQDSIGIWRIGVIIKIESDRVLVNYSGWSHQYDEWISISSPRLLPRGEETDKKVKKDSEPYIQLGNNVMYISRPSQTHTNIIDTDMTIEEGKKFYVIWVINCEDYYIQGTIDTVNSNETVNIKVNSTFTFYNIPNSNLLKNLPPGCQEASSQTIKKLSQESSEYKNTLKPNQILIRRTSENEEEANVFDEKIDNGRFLNDYIHNKLQTKVEIPKKSKFISSSLSHSLQSLRRSHSLEDDNSDIFMSSEDDDDNDDNDNNDNDSDNDSDDNNDSDDDDNDDNDNNDNNDDSDDDNHNNINITSDDIRSFLSTLIANREGHGHSQNGQRSEPVSFNLTDLLRSGLLNSLSDMNDDNDDN